ncbi:MAG TPA: type II toxin-antitoxin system HicB family antitoxin [Candidatus Methylomirabilis sp.]|nr:type II toxin-antitoxin system HicB family antitoxin [Candidatus Methylomirabilis sp.]
MNPRYHVIFRPEPEGGFTVIVPSLPGCISYGKDLEEAQRMITEAIELYIEDLKADNEEVPSDESVFATEIQLQ